MLLKSTLAKWWLQDSGRPVSCSPSALADVAAQVLVGRRSGVLDPVRQVLVVQEQRGAGRRSGRGPGPRRRPGASGWLPRLQVEAAAHQVVAAGAVQDRPRRQHPAVAGRQPRRRPTGGPGVLQAAAPDGVGPEHLEGFGPVGDARRSGRRFPVRSRDPPRIFL